MVSAHFFKYISYYLYLTCTLDSDYEVSSSSTETPISGDTVGVKNCSNFTALEDMTVEQSIETVTFTISITFDYLVNERVIVGQQTATIFIRDIDCEL